MDEIVLPLFCKLYFFLLANLFHLTGMVCISRFRHAATHTTLALTLFVSSSFTLLGSHSEWPKDKPFLLMHSRHATNLYNPKIKIIFEIAWMLFEITLFIHINKHLDGAKTTIWNFFIMDYCLPLQMNKVGPKIFWFSCMG
jgi:hypothetical protein